MQEVRADSADVVTRLFGLVGGNQFAAAPPSRGMRPLSHGSLPPGRFASGYLPSPPDERDLYLQSEQNYHWRDEHRLFDHSDWDNHDHY